MLRIQREEFQRDLLQSVGAVRQCVTAIQNERKNLKLNPKKAEAIKTRIKDKQSEVKLLITDVGSTLDEVGK
jgi:DNA-binding XRE family transcriptional regulator